MNRIRYSSQGVSNGTEILVSTQALETEIGKALVFLYLTAEGVNTFSINDSVNGNVLASGSTKGGHVVLKRTAKKALEALLKDSPFTKESRKKRS